MEERVFFFHGSHKYFGACHPDNLSKILCTGSGVIIEKEVKHELLSEAETAWAQREWSIQHVLFPSMRLFFKPSVSMASNGTFVQVFFVFANH